MQAARDLVERTVSRAETVYGPAGVGDLHVTAAGAYEHVLDELIPAFTQEFGVPIRLTVANAAGVIKRLEAKETVDVVLTSAAGIEHLIAGGRADQASSMEIGRMRLGIAVAPGLPLPDLSTAASVRSFLLAAPHVKAVRAQSVADRGDHHQGYDSRCDSLAPAVPRR